MSRGELKKTIKREIRGLNWKIDMKIVRGLSYRDEARRHKFLVMQLRRLTKPTGFGFFTRMSGAMTSFML